MSGEKKATSYNQTGSQMKEVQERLEAVLEAEKKKIKSESPEFVEAFGIISSVQCYKKRPKGYYKKVVDRVLMYLLRPKGYERTQKSITDDVRRDLPEYDTIYETIWQKRLEAWEKKQIQALITDRVSLSLNIKGCKTLSEVKEMLKGYYLAKNNSNRVIKPAIGIGADALTVNKTIYDIEEARTHPSIRVTVGGKRVWLRVDALVQFLETK